MLTLRRANQFVIERWARRITLAIYGKGATFVFDGQIELIVITPLRSALARARHVVVHKNFYIYLYYIAVLGSLSVALSLARSRVMGADFYWDVSFKRAGSGGARASGLR